MSQGFVSAQICGVYIRVVFPTSPSTGALTDFLFPTGLGLLMKLRETQYPQDPCPSAKSDCRLATGSKAAGRKGGKGGKERGYRDRHTRAQRHSNYICCPDFKKKKEVKKIRLRHRSG